MTLSQITREHILSAISEYDRLGGEGFLREYGYDDPVWYSLLHDGREYPAKGIVGVAHTLGIGHRVVPLSGGEGPNRVLRRLGFEIVDHRDQPSESTDVEGAHIFLVPASNSAARDNFARSVAEPIHPADYLKHVDPDFQSAVEVDGHFEPLHLWGSRPGGRRESTWNQLKRGDFVLFVQRGEYTAVARVLAKTRDPDLSHAIWREDDGEAFELIYGLSPPSFISVPQDELAKWLPVMVRGFMRLGDDREMNIVQEFGSVKTFVEEKLLGNSRDPITWWVNQGRTYFQERDGGYMWAPKKSRGAGVGPRPYWQTMTEVQVGDRIVHYRNSAIRAVSRASSVAEDALRPGELPSEAWEEEGWIVRTQYEELADPVRLDSIPSEWRVPESGPFNVTGRVQQGYLFKLSEEFGEELARMLEERETQPPGPEPSPEPEDEGLAQLAKLTFLEPPELEELIELIQTRRQVIFHGPPGSGKTWVAEKLARYITGNPLDTDELNSRFELIQFHQSYGYEDFMQGIRPLTTEKGTLEYRVLPGILMRFISQQGPDPQDDFVLVIDEINRGDISRIFGELLLLLEYRDKKVRLPYADAKDPKFNLPPRLVIIGTMNTADRSLATVDYALRRRFAFHRMAPVEHGEAPILKQWLDSQPSISSTQKAEVLRLFLTLNKHVEELMGAAGEDFQIGHSYFMSPQIFTQPGRARIWRTSIRPLLEEYFANRKERIGLLDKLEPEALLHEGESPEAPELEIEEDAT